MAYLQSFDSIRKEMEEFDAEREEVIQQAREIIKVSKLVIYSVHRKEIEEAVAHAEELKRKVKELPEDSHDTGIHKVAWQEYVEAMCFLEFVKDKRIPTKEELEVKTEDYLLGLCDLTGELVRAAVNSVVDKNPERALEIKELVDEIYGEFLKLDLRNSELRKKADSIRWNLRKLEDIALGISVQGMAK